MSTDEAQLAARLAEAAAKVTVGARYKHYKQLIYKVVALALREEDLVPCVVYQAEYGSRLTFIRPLSNWLEQIDIDGTRVNRFTLLP